MVGTITIDAGRFERATYQDEWRTFRMALEDAGYTVRDGESAIEYRDMRGPAPELAQATIDLAVAFADAIDEEAKGAAIGQLIGLMFKHLAGPVRIGRRKGDPRRVRILGPRGEVLREVELPEVDPDDQEMARAAP